MAKADSRVVEERLKDAAPSPSRSKFGELASTYFLHCGLVGAVDTELLETWPMESRATRFLLRLPDKLVP